MKKKKNDQQGKKKLSLNKESIHKLTEQELSQAAGALGTWTTGTCTCTPVLTISSTPQGPISA
jgi:hypothetical protein